MIDARIVTNPQSIRAGGVGPVSGDVWLEIAGTAFPAQGWNDFVVLILEAWASALLELLRGDSINAAVYFMEGPYEVKLRRASAQELELHTLGRGREEMNRVVVPVRPLVESIVASGEGILSACRSKNLWSSDAGRLHALLPKLEVALSQQEA